MSSEVFGGSSPSQLLPRFSAPVARSIWGFTQSPCMRFERAHAYCLAFWSAHLRWCVAALSFPASPSWLPRSYHALSSLSFAPSPSYGSSRFACTRGCRAHQVVRSHLAIFGGRPPRRAAAVDLRARLLRRTPRRRPRVLRLVLARRPTSAPRAAAASAARRPRRRLLHVVRAVASFGVLRAAVPAPSATAFFGACPWRRESAPQERPESPALGIFVGVPACPSAELAQTIVLATKVKSLFSIRLYAYA